MPIVDDTSITEILSSDDIVSEIANAPHDELKSHIDELNTHHDGDLVHSGSLTISGGDLYADSGIIESLTADDVYLPSVVKIQSLTPISANVTSEALNELTSGGETTLHTHGQAEVKAWINFDGTAASFPAGINDSYNVSSVVDNDVGNYTINWDTDFADTNYCWVASARDYNDVLSDISISALSSDTKTTSALQIKAIENSSYKDLPEINLIVMGDQ